MAISEAYTGTHTVSTTEWSLTTDTASLGAQTTDGVYQIFVDFNAATSADTFYLKIYEKATSGATQRLVEVYSIVGGAASKIYATPPIILIHGWDFSLTKLSGTDQSLVWSIRKLG